MKYQSLNVLSQKKRNDFMSDDAITEVSNMIKATGKNRKERRKLVKSLGRMETILEHSQKYVDRSAYKEYQKCVDKNFVHFFACLAMTMLEEYKWEESDDNEQISELLMKVDKKIKEYADMGYETEDIVNFLDEKTEIRLVADTH